MTQDSEVFPDMVGIFDTNDNFALVATSELDQAGIIYDIVPISELLLNKAPESGPRCQDHFPAAIS